MSKRTSVRPRGIHGGRVGRSNGSGNGDPFLDDIVDIGQDIGEGNKAVVRSRGVHRGRCDSSSAIGEGDLVADELYKESSHKANDDLPCDSKYSSLEKRRKSIVRSNDCNEEDQVIPFLSSNLNGCLEALAKKEAKVDELTSHKTRLEAAKSCKIILDIIESSLPEGLPENFVELLPELWKLAGSSQEAVLSFRRALLHHQSLNPETKTKIQKDFAFFFLYNGGEEAVPPNLRSQMDSSFVPRNNIEEVILLLMTSLLIYKAFRTFFN
ncbi:hypothetical protein Tco_1082797 [Tanacetum coccineum]|uniref:Uncharacterized protein n=1 Tax=Tanacetum coccineum TaxID=301880 RepID=A0ABQ5I3L4_9ASTR